MKKNNIENIYDKNHIITNIIDAMAVRNHFLIVGHENPDEDCIASMMAFALVLSKLCKDTSIFLGSPVQEHLLYLVNICRHNSIRLLSGEDKIKGPVDTVVVCDTPKSAMIDHSDAIRLLLERNDVLIMEIDHHIGGDSEYIGDKGYCLVTNATSSSELVGHIVCKLGKRKDVLQKYQITNLFSRNLVLSLLTGIIADTNLGRYLRTKREKKYYEIFSSKLNNLLLKETSTKNFLSNKEEVFKELQSHSVAEESCFLTIMQKKKFSSNFGYVVLTRRDMEQLHDSFGNDIFVSVSRAVADILAEQSGRFSLVAYFDNHEGPELFQFRMRRSYRYKKFDLRSILDHFSIRNGGGHEGAIGFRIPVKRIKNLDSYVSRLIAGVEKVV
jgi:nanoRNase/pAp phosphatase (c-di-AMP/oligoRNAs hydrolase)